MSDSITNEENLTNKDAHIEHTQHTSNYTTESLETQGESSNLVYFSIGKNIKDKSVKNEECEWQEFKEALIINPQKYTVRYDNHKTDEKTGRILQDKDTGKYIELAQSGGFKDADDLMEYYQQETLDMCFRNLQEAADRGNRQAKSYLKRYLPKYKMQKRR